MALWPSISKGREGGREGGGGEGTKGPYVTPTNVCPLQKIDLNIFPRVNNNKIIHIITLQNTISNINYASE
jgi:hypothetical protein